MRSLAIALVSILASACGSADSAPGTPSVTDPPGAVTAVTVSGPVVGRAQGGVTVFRRVPYAAPPVGALRFAPPAPVVPWTTPRDATVPGSECARFGSIFGGPAPAGEEDCLHVNVFTPGVRGARPVMVWIHGGGFLTGSGSEPVYDGTRFALDHNTVVVTINYRLGVFGFLSHPSLATPTGGTGNWGFLDQQAALRWVQANASRFGGDPARVTIFGESAGATSVLLHNVSAGSRGLFARSIVESSPAPRLPDLARANGFGERVAQGVGCTSGDVAACLRAAEPQRLYNALTSSGEPGGPFFQERGFYYLPTIDGVSFTEQPLASFRAGRSSAAPMILGTNSDEGTVFTAGIISPAITSEAQYRAALVRGAAATGLTTTQAEMIAAQYPVSRYDSPNAALTAVTTEGFFACATRYIAQKQRAAGHAVWLYRFDQEPGHVGIDGLGVFHAAELSFVFGVENGILGDNTSAPALATAMRGYWTRFAANATPAGSPLWPAYTPEGDLRLRLASAISIESADPDRRCGFWSGLFDTL